MKRISKEVLKTVKLVMDKEVDQIFNGWPPCSGIVHQPKRPVEKISDMEVKQK